MAGEKLAGDVLLQLRPPDTARLQRDGRVGFTAASLGRRRKLTSAVAGGRESAGISYGALGTLTLVPEAGPLDA
jgi:hypothetical protein